MLLAAGGFWVVYHNIFGNIAHIDAFDALAKNGIHRPAEDTKAQNFLLIGSDTRAGADAVYNAAKGSADYTSGERSDTMMLVHVPTGPAKASIISFPRDSWVEIPRWTDTKGAHHPAHMSKLNAAFSEGGSPLLVATLEQLSGIRVDHVVQIDFTGFKNMVNALGGIEVCVKTTRHDHDSGDNLTAGGMHLIKGDAALAFVRDRKGLPGGDIDRIADQQYFLSVVLHKVLSAKTLTNPTKLYHFATAATRSLTTDKGFGLRQMESLATRLHSIDPAHVTFLQVPVLNNSARENGQSVVELDHANLPAVFAAMKDNTGPADTSPTLGHDDSCRPHDAGSAADREPVQDPGTGRQRLRSGPPRGPDRQGPQDARLHGAHLGQRGEDPCHHGVLRHRQGRLGPYPGRCGARGGDRGQDLARRDARAGPRRQLHHDAGGHGHQGDQACQGRGCSHHDRTSRASRQDHPAHRRSRFGRRGQGADRGLGQLRAVTPAGLLTRALTRDGARPLLTFYDDATGERVELSVATYANWVSKTANMLQDGLSAEPGERVAVLLPTHWQTAVILSACWAAGLVAATGLEAVAPADIVFTAADTVEAARSSTQGRARWWPCRCCRLPGPPSDCRPECSTTPSRCRPTVTASRRTLPCARRSRVRRRGRDALGRPACGGRQRMAGLEPGARVLSTSDFTDLEAVVRGLLGPLVRRRVRRPVPQPRPFARSGAAHRRREGHRPLALGGRTDRSPRCYASPSRSRSWRLKGGTW